MLPKPDNSPSLTTSYRPNSLISSIMKLFERVIEQRLRSHLEQIGLTNNNNVNISQISEQLSLPMIIFLGYPNPSWKALTEENM